MNSYKDTSKGKYLASINRKIRNNYKPFHNKLVEALEKAFTVIYDEKDNFIGCGAFIEYPYEDHVLRLLITAGHVLDDLKIAGNKIKLPINYFLKQNETRPDEAMCAPLILDKNNHIIDREFDIGVVQGFTDLYREGYAYYKIKTIDNDQDLIGLDVLIMGINANRIEKAERKNREVGTGEILVNGFQMPTKIAKIDSPYFYINYPSTIFITKPDNFDAVLEARSPSPKGLSGSVVWDYSRGDLYKPIGIIIEREDQYIKCIGINKISSVIFESIESIKRNVLTLASTLTTGISLVAG